MVYLWIRWSLILVDALQQSILLARRTWMGTARMRESEEVIVQVIHAIGSPHRKVGQLQYQMFSSGLEGKLDPIRKTYLSRFQFAAYTAVSLTIRLSFRK